MRKNHGSKRKAHEFFDQFHTDDTATYWLVLMIILIVMSSLHGMKLSPKTRNSMISRNLICQKQNHCQHTRNGISPCKAIVCKSIMH